MCVPLPCRVVPLDTPFIVADAHLTAREACNPNLSSVLWVTRPGHQKCVQKLPEGLSVRRLCNHDDRDAVQCRAMSSKQASDLQLRFGFWPVPCSCVHIWQRARRATGIAIVEFPSAEEAAAALTKHMQSMGDRYIELFPATLLDLHYFQKQNQVTLSKLAQE